MYNSDQCATECTSSKLKIKDLKWTKKDSIIAAEPENEEEEEEPEPGQLIWGGVAPSLTSGDCESNCAECREAWFENFPMDKFF